MIVATAGHVDHGKTSLIRALTGVDTDSLPDEKRRGMSIDLGFAYLPVDSESSEVQDPIGFVDVPGHQGFVRNALAGIGGVDRALLVLAADDGPMLQTLEHLAVLGLLEIPLAAVVITKTDRVPAARVSELAEEIRRLLDASALKPAPVFPVASTSGAGIAELKVHLVQLAAALPPRAAGGNFRLAVDRAFTVNGAGLVVTGTVVSGSLMLGDAVRILGTPHCAKVRSIHAQHRKSPTCRAGQRCALNLAGSLPKADEIARGDWVVAGEVPEPQRKMDARLRLMHSEVQALKHWAPVHLHLGAAHVMARVAVLEGTCIEPGHSARVQLVLDQPLGAAAGDRFIVRDASAQRTLGGGRIIDVFPPLRGRSRPERLSQLRSIELADPAASLGGLLDHADKGVLLDPFRRNRNLDEQQSAALFEALPSKHVATSEGPLAFAPERWAELRTAVLDGLRVWHERMPSLAGPSADRILQGTRYSLPRDAVLAIANELVREGAIAKRGMYVSLPTHQLRLNVADEALWAQVRPLISAGDLRPPTVFEISYVIRVDAKTIEAMLGRAAHCGHVIRLTPRRYYLRDSVVALAEAAQKIAQDCPDRSFTAAAFRDRSGLGRNLSIEVLEFFDQVKYTRRVGNRHVLISLPHHVFGAG